MTCRQATSTDDRSGLANQSAATFNLGNARLITIGPSGPSTNETSLETPANCGGILIDRQTAHCMGGAAPGRRGHEPLPGTPARAARGLTSSTKRPRAESQ